MSQENVEIVRRFTWALENDRDVFLETLHPDIEWRPFEEANTPSHGHAGALQIRDRWLTAWEEHRIELGEFHHDGDDVVSSVHITARGRGSGVEVDVYVHGHFKIRDGKIVYFYEHEDKAEALAAAGLSE
jgi:ketosteroid isomerase-like protein